MPTPTKFAAISIILLALTTACSSSEQSQEGVVASTPAKAIAPAPKLVVSKTPAPAASPTPQPKHFQEALDTAIGAAVIAQSAQSKDDWQLVSSRWQSAINLLKAVPKSNQNHAMAQKKIIEYQRNLAYAQQQKKNSSKPAVAANTSPVVAVVPTQASPPTVATTRKPNPSLSATTPRQPRTAVSPEMAIALHLKKVGAKMYGAYWCPACTRQKQEFSEQAFKQITYVECDPAGEKARPDLCRQANVPAYPTWEVNGQLYRGVHSLAELAIISGYQDVQNSSQ